MVTWNSITEHFKKTDYLLYSIIKRPIQLSVSPTPFEDLIESVISQQLSLKASDKIYKRFVDMLPKNEVSPQVILSMSDEAIRTIGTSWSKVRYIKNIARASIDFDGFHAFSDEEVIEKLTVIKGVGRWTAEMFLMFSLGRPDIFSFGDAGLKRAIMKLYSLKKEPSHHTLIKISNQWKPYRTYAARILWTSLDN